MKRYLSTALMTARTQLNAGAVYLLPNLFIKVMHLLPLLFLWRTLMGQGVDAGMNLDQMLSYTYLATVLGSLLAIETPLTSWLYDGQIVSMLKRPLSVYGLVVSQTLGGALPELAFFSLPMLLLAPLFGISMVPKSMLFFPSLLLCMSLGFAVDLLFACLMMHMMNGRYLVIVIRGALNWLFAGTFIPFAALPGILGTVLANMPLGSLGGAPLSIFAGISSPLQTLMIQLFWNLTIWPLAYFAFEKSRERMVSHGG